MRRTQGEYDLIADFVTCIRALFKRLSPPWKLEEQLNYAHRNVAMFANRCSSSRDIHNFASLKSLATRVELGYEAMMQYRALPMPEESIFPDLAYRPPRTIGKKLAIAVAVLLR